MRLQVLAFRENFIPGDGPFYTPGGVATSALLRDDGDEKISSKGNQIVTVTVTNLPPGESPLLPATSTLGLEVSDDPERDTPKWVNAVGVTVRGNTVLVEGPSAVRTIRQVRNIKISSSEIIHVELGTYCFYSCRA